MAGLTLALATIANFDWNDRLKLMKRFFGKTILATVICSLLAFSAAAQTKLGLVDLRKIFDNYYKTKQASVSLKEEVADLEKQLKEMADDLKKGEDDWKKLLDKSNDQAIAAEEREKNKQAAQKKLVELRDMEQTATQFQRSSKARLDEKNRRKREAILEEIREVVNAKAKAGGYTMVFDSAASSVNDTPVIMYNNGENDLTETVLSQLNAGAPPLTPTADEKPKAAERK
jgi:outer membrane protein